MKKDWEIKKLGDICDFFAGYTPKQNELSDLGDIPYFKVSDMNRDGNELFMSETELYAVSPKKIIPKDSIVFPKNGGAVFTNKKRILSQDSVIDLNSEGLFHKDYIDVMFLYYFLQLIDLKDYSKGAALPTIDMTALKNVSINVPPLEEQKRIVKILDEKFAQLESLKANAQTNLQNAKDLFQSQLTKAFSNTTWEKKKLRDLTDSSLSYGSSSPSCEYDEKVRYIRITDINDEGFLNEEFVSPKFYDEKHILEDGDVLFARTGATVGKAYCYHNEDGKCVYAGYLIRLRPNQEIVIPNYIYLCTKSKEYEDFIKTSQAAAAQPNVNAEKYGNFEIPLPPLPEQKRIVEELDTLSEKVRLLQEIYTKQIANCDELKQSLLQKAFQGEL